MTDTDTNTKSTAEQLLPDQNIAAERAVLGAMLASHDAVNLARLELTAAAFYRPTHAELFATIIELEDAGHRCDAQLLVTHLAAKRKLGTDGTLTNAIFDMWAETYDAANVGYHALAVRTAARIRALQAEHVRMGQALTQAFDDGDADALLDAAAQRSLALQLLTDEPDSAAPIDGLMTWTDFVEHYRQTEQRWIVPDLISRHDVFLILSAPGAGKSFLSRMVMTALASGVHPFTLEPITPVRTLLVDLENAPEQVAEDTDPMLPQVQRLGHSMDDRGWVFTHMAGFNLRKHEDAALFERAIAETRPDVVAFGSLYNSYDKGRDDWDTAISEVQTVLKRIRARYNVAFWIEHHMSQMPGGGFSGTPYGGTAWGRWATHGRVLRKASDIVPIYLLEAGTFRGDRGARDIPAGLRRGGKLPFTALYDQLDIDNEIEAANQK